MSVCFVCCCLFVCLFILFRCCCFYLFCFYIVVFMIYTWSIETSTQNLHVHSETQRGRQRKTETETVGCRKLMNCETRTDDTLYCLQAAALLKGWCSYADKCAVAELIFCVPFLCRCLCFWCSSRNRCASWPAAPNYWWQLTCHFYSCVCVVYILKAKSFSLKTIHCFFF